MLCALFSSSSARFEILADDRCLAVDSLAERGLAGRDALRREFFTAAAARQPHLERSGDAGLQQKAAIGMGDRDRVIEHGGQHRVQRELRMQQGRGFKQQIQLAQARRRGGRARPCSRYVSACSRWKMGRAMRSER